MTETERSQLDTSEMNEMEQSLDISEMKEMEQNSEHKMDSSEDSSTVIPDRENSRDRQLRKMEARLANMDARFATIEGENRVKTQQIQQLQRRVETAEKTMVQQKWEIEDKGSQIRALRNTIDEMRTKVRDLTRQREHPLELDELKEQIQQAREMKKDLEKDLQQSKETGSQLHAQLLESNAIIQELQHT
eukprot:scaffold2621_cov118-Cylindrotheca_fusiformis.AAC.1